FHAIGFPVKSTFSRKNTHKIRNIFTYLSTLDALPLFRPQGLPVATLTGSGSPCRPPPYRISVALPATTLPDQGHIPFLAKDPARIQYRPDLVNVNTHRLRFAVIAPVPAFINIRRGKYPVAPAVIDRKLLKLRNAPLRSLEHRSRTLTRHKRIRQV